MWGFTAKGGESTRPPGLQTTTNYEYGGLTFWHEKIVISNFPSPDIAYC